MRDISVPIGAVLDGSDKDDLNSLPFSALIPALSFALDLTEERPMGHVLRSCLIGMHIGAKIHLPQAKLVNLFQALLLKDVGCSNYSSRVSDVVNPRRPKKKYDSHLAEHPGFERDQYRNPPKMENHKLSSQEKTKHISRRAENSHLNLDAISRYRCERAARISHDLGLSKEVTEALYEVDERWDGSGYPNNLQDEQISILARIINLSQTLDVATERYGRATAIDIISKRCGTWFDSGLVAASNLLHDRCELWRDLQLPDLLSRVIALEPRSSEPAPVLLVDNICLAFAEVVDAKSPFTFTHSTGVAKIAVSIAELMGQNEKSIKLLQRASLLHDIGKLSVPNSILEKPGSLTPKEWRYIYQHPRHTKEILDKIPGFEEIAQIAAVHHEKLNGTGYPYGLSARELPLLARVLTIADIYDALSSFRPYRQKLGYEQVIRLMRRDAPHALDQFCLEALVVAVRQNSARSAAG
jgi:putative nucleotidyltransferase with HDIG domain